MTYSIQPPKDYEGNLEDYAEEIGARAVGNPAGTWEAAMQRQNLPVVFAQYNKQDTYLRVACSETELKLLMNQSGTVRVYMVHYSRLRELAPKALDHFYALGGKFNERA